MVSFQHRMNVILTPFALVIAFFLAKWLNVRASDVCVCVLAIIIVVVALARLKIALNQELTKILLEFMAIISTQDEKRRIACILCTCKSSAQT